MSDWPIIMCASILQSDWSVNMCANILQSDWSIIMWGGGGVSKNSEKIVRDQIIIFKIELINQSDCSILAHIFINQSDCSILAHIIIDQSDCSILTHTIFDQSDCSIKARIVIDQSDCIMLYHISILTGVNAIIVDMYSEVVGFCGVRRGHISQDKL